MPSKARQKIEHFGASRPGVKGDPGPQDPMDLLVAINIIESMAVTTDAWTSSTTQGYITLTGHYIDAD